jgi:hypothetical protein
LRKRTLLLAATLTTGLLTALPVTTATAAPSKLAGDFNGDGYRDLAIGAPNATVSGKPQAGYVGIVYGTKNGLNTAKRQVISQATAGIPGAPESGDYFGDRLTTGDLDGDGYTDLVVGVSAQSLGTSGRSGVVTIVWGGAGGLKTSSDLTWPLPANRDGFGAALATGDFDGDGDTDLATKNGFDPQLNVFKGPFTRAGKSTGRVDIDTYTETGITVEELVAGDVNGDGRADLLVMGQQEISDGYKTRSVLYKGTATGPKAGPRVAGGYAGVIADIDKDGYGDIVTGNFLERSSEAPDGGLGGAITVTYGSATGISSARTPVRITQDTAGVPDTGEKRDQFGWSLSAGDTNGDGYTDIAVGAPTETIGSAREAGTITILRGAKTGLSTTGAKLFWQNTAGVPDSAESLDFFGSAVQLTDTDNNRRAELVVSADNENRSAGAVWLFKTDTAGITATGSKTFTSTTLGGPSGQTRFGATLAG